MHCAGEFIDMCDQYPTFLQSSVTVVETWCYEYNPESKRQTMQWCSPTSPHTNWSLLQDNAYPHTATSVCQLLDPMPCNYSRTSTILFWSGSCKILFVLSPQKARS
ncbi:hypothetical protein NPIL_636901 [Nephila pilipes]|uniref:Uncharacterized protein n=1 Tax=Nephila pilipes TaxID=299642 RepID=A0A8X6R053_NEPPI|nr:hypothetical protein NPIL_636901 [Nephila pilipes]